MQSYKRNKCFEQRYGMNKDNVHFNNWLRPIHKLITSITKEIMKFTDTTKMTQIKNLPF